MVNLSTRRAAGWLLALVLVAAFAAQCLWFVSANGQTYDEGVTLASGLRLVETGYDDINQEHPPLSKLLVAWPVHHFALPHLDVAPWQARRESGFGLGRDLFYNSGVPHERLLWLGRLPVVTTALLTVVAIGLLAWQLFGPRAGLLALGLAAFDPTLVAHGSLISMDMPLTLFVTMGFLATAMSLRSQQPVWLWLAGVSAGLATATKFSAPLFLAGLGVALVVSAARRGTMAAWWDLRTPATSTGRSVAHALANGALVLAVGAVVLTVVIGAAGWPAFIVGFQAQLDHQAVGHPAFFMGAIARAGWTFYFPAALVMKLPPVTLLAAVASVVAWRRGAPWGDGLAVVLLPLVVLLGSMLAASIDIGVRYALPLWPLVIVAASRVATWPRPSARWAGGAALVALVYHPVAALRAAPHDLAFFSDLVGGPTQGIRYLSDSNLDWGQDIETLRRWLATQPQPQRLYLSYFGTADPRGYGINYVPAPNSCAHAAPWTPAPEPESGRTLLAVSAMNLQGVYFGDVAAYAWLTSRTPVATLGHSIVVYDITNDPDAHESLGRMYERYGPASRAADEFSRALRLRAGVR